MRLEMMVKKMGDYVDRQKLKEAISADCQHLFSFDTSLYEMFMIDIDEMPSENVRKDVQGEWVFDSDWWDYVCTNCRGRIGNIKTYKFCPHCGARMKL